MIERITGVDIPEKYQSIVTILTIVVAVYGMDWAYKKITAKKADNDAEGKGGSISITGNRNILINVAGDALELPPEKIAAAVENAIKPVQRDLVAKWALSFIAPAKRELTAAISGGGAVITPEAIADAPSELDMDLNENGEQHDPYQRQMVAIHATDMDRAKTGWAGHLPGLWKRRLRMQLYPGIDPKSLFGKQEIVADIILVSKANKDGEPVPYLFHVVKVYE